MVALPGRVLSSGTLSTLQRAGIDASRSGCSRRHSCSGSRIAAAAAAGRVHRQIDTKVPNGINVPIRTPEYRTPELSKTLLRVLNTRDLLSRRMQISDFCRL